MHPSRIRNKIALKNKLIPYVNSLFDYIIYTLLTSVINENVLKLKLLFVEKAN